MRDIKRIDRITELLSTLWKYCPDYRFWQLIQALEVPEEKVGTDPFFWEDDVWENIFLNNIKRCQNACEDEEKD